MALAEGGCYGPRRERTCRASLKEPARRGNVLFVSPKENETMRSALLWLIGVPIPIILLIWFATGHA